jgi:3-methyladenine DNA glycosylase AlkD
MKEEIKSQVEMLMKSFEPSASRKTADGLRNIWLGYEAKSITGIKEEERAKQETVGISVFVLQTIGNEVAKTARQRVGEFIPLMKMLWDEYGREGRVVSVFPLGKMELANPETILPLTLALCRSCYTWEDADQLAMRAVEPIVRKDPEIWLPKIEPWLEDENRWVRRTGVTVIGRLPMKHATYTSRCLELAGSLLLDQEEVVKKATSFAIRLCARGEIQPVIMFLEEHVPPPNPAASWVLCDVIRSMARAFMPDFAPLLPLYEQWLLDEDLDPKSRRSVESAIRVLRKAV